MNGTLISLIVTGIILLSVYTDIRWSKIPNYITLSAMGLGILLHGIPWFSNKGAGFAFSGALVGLCIFIVPFALGGMGGGDVKLFAAIGAWLGFLSVIWVALYTALAGGLLALFFIITKKKTTKFKEIPTDILFLILTRSRIKNSEIRNVLPYSVAIAAGWFVYLGIGSLV